ncbi:hypothetical protein Bca52824_045565 [Brassica carinata]|uniref:Uncharacterized protein n=1 Tax=Brassica carinata TaxID=52824 RepID=A0A8X7UQC2_BRACI|nr:hypothetical protein Bca52824_045565 [Brassica carinata]
MKKMMARRPREEYYILSFSYQRCRKKQRKEASSFKLRIIGCGRKCHTWFMKKATSRSSRIGLHVVPRMPSC